MKELKEIGNIFKEFDKATNTLKEIPKDTIAEWFKEAQKSSMDNYNRIDSRYCEMYLQLRTEGWRIAERNKDAFNEMYLNLSKQIEGLKKQIKK